MKGVTKFTLKDVRCFAGEQSIDIRPITLLVGENSTGKSTVLGCYDALSQLIRGRHAINFNHTPYRMGGVKNIARKSGKLNKTCNEFALEKCFIQGNETFILSVVFGESGADYVITKVKYALKSGGSVTFIAPAPSSRGEFEMEDTRSFQFLPRRSQQSKNNFVFRADIGMESPMHLPMILRHWERANQKSTSPEFKKFWERFCALTRHIPVSMFWGRERVISMAPIRSEPQRTYDPLTDDPAPDGGDIPMYMTRIAGSKEWELTQKKLCVFGKRSGMFEGIEINKPFGAGTGDPFQIEFRIGGGLTNIRDVGYGVSQLLPILVRMIKRERTPFRNNSRFLLQQPEVHLHPQAQAELASLLVDFARKGKGQNYLIETHSDYIVDRIRIEIARGNIAPEHVSLAYHEKKKGGSVQIHNIGFDKYGNLISAPVGYRAFFMRETNNLLGFEE